MSRRACQRGLIAAVLLAIAGATPAHADELPAGRFGVVAGLRAGGGAFGDRFDPGPIWGLEAGYNRTDTERNWSFGLAWSVLWGWFGPARPSVNDGSLWLLEMNFGGRVRRLLGDEDLAYLIGSVGFTLLRTNTPIPPDMEQSYAGPYAGIGVEGYLADKYLLSFEVRYGLFTIGPVGGPGTLSLLFGFSFGTS